MNYPKILLKKGKEESASRFHPWIFSGAVYSLPQGIKEGDTVEVLSSEKEFVGIGHWQEGTIAVRILTFENEPINEDFWKRRIEDAYLFRKSIGLVNPPYNDTYRLIYGEGDGLGGLIVDMYNHSAVMQAHSIGIHQNRYLIAHTLKLVLGDELERVYYKSEDTLPIKEGIEGAKNGYLLGEECENCIATENGLHFNVDWLKGQKTGFFVDQRENRMLLQRYAKGRNVLNMFCYTGGFSFYAMRGGATMVHSVDSSAKAISLTDENVELNFPHDARHQSFVEDAFKYLEKMEERYDLMILDPPAFAKHRSSLHNALQGYRRLNAKALRKIRKGGLLFTFSCSQVVSKEDFRLAVFSAAVQARRRVSIIHQLTQPADHPINIYHPEGEYLKGLVLKVE